MYVCPVVPGGFLRTTSSGVWIIIIPTTVDTNKCLYRSLRTHAHPGLRPTDGPADSAIALRLLLFDVSLAAGVTVELVGDGNIHAAAANSARASRVAA